MSEKNDAEGLKKVEVVTITLKKTGEERDVFLKEPWCPDGIMAKEVDFEMDCTNWDAFFEVMPTETLESFKAKALKDEKFEFVVMIQKHIDSKKK